MTARTRPCSSSRSCASSESRTRSSLRSSLLSGVRSGLAATRAGATKIIDETEKDLPMKAVLFGLIVFTLPLAVLYQAIVHSIWVSIPMTIVMIPVIRITTESCTRWLSRLMMH